MSSFNRALAQQSDTIGRILLDLVCAVCIVAGIAFLYFAFGA